MGNMGNLGNMGRGFIEHTDIRNSCFEIFPNNQLVIKQMERS